MGDADRRPGRRPGPTETRGKILAAARTLFGERGYEKATIRGIAGEAGVDPALVHHFFGTKEEVFVAAMELPVDPSVVLPELVEGDRDAIGERFLRYFLSLWRDPVTRAPFLALLRAAATNEQAAKMLRGFITTAMFGRVAEALRISPLRIEAAASHLIGLALLRYVVCVEPVASVDEEEVVALIAPVLQRYLGPED